MRTEHGTGRGRRSGHAVSGQVTPGEVMSGQVMITPEYAVGRAVARLGRRAQDPLEVAVVLEAWSGVRPLVALATAEEVTFDAPLVGSRRAGKRPRRWKAAAAGIALSLLSVVWLQQLEVELGGDTVLDALWVGLPVALAGVAAIHRRYLVAEHGLGLLHHDWKRLVVVMIAVLVVVACLPAGWLAASVAAAVWASSLAVERWPVASVLVPGVALLGPPTEVASTPVAAAAAAALLGVLAVLAVSGTATDTRAPVPLARLIGPVAAMAGFALLVITTASDGGATGWIMVIGLTPMLVGLSVAAAIADRLWTTVPSELAADPVAGRRSWRAGREAQRVMAGTVISYLVVTMIGSIPVALIEPRALVADMWVVGLVGLASMLIESSGRPVGSAVLVGGALAAVMWGGWAAVLLMVTAVVAAVIVEMVVDVDRSFAVRW